TVTSADLTKDAHAVAAADITIPGGQPGRLDADLTVTQPMKADGSFDVAVDKVQGKGVAKSIPTALLQPVPASTPLLAARDLGRTVDASAAFQPGAAPNLNHVQLAVNGEHLQLSGVAETDLSADTLRGSDLHVVTTVQPALLESLGGVRSDGPLGVDIA